jgi:hypothetical protein
MPIGAKMYKAASEEKTSEPEGETKKDDEPVEGEVVDEKDTK